MSVMKLVRDLIVILIFLAAFFPIYINVSVFASIKQENLDEKNTKRALIPSFVEHEGVIYKHDPT